VGDRRSRQLSDHQQQLHQPTPSRSSINLPRPSLSLTGPTLPTGDPSSDAASAQAEDQILKAASVVASDLSKIHKDVSAFWSERVEHLLQRTLVPEEVKRIQSESFEEATICYGFTDLSAVFVASYPRSLSLGTVRTVRWTFRSHHLDSYAALHGSAQASAIDCIAASHIDPGTVQGDSKAKPFHTEHPQTFGRLLW
jgi:hypothetical protein